MGKGGLLLLLLRGGLLRPVRVVIPDSQILQEPVAEWVGARQGCPGSPVGGILPTDRATAMGRALHASVWRETTPSVACSLGATLPQAGHAGRLRRLYAKLVFWPLIPSIQK